MQLARAHCPIEIDADVHLALYSEEQHKEKKNMINPKISVIIPTYNRPDKLHRALVSVLSQSYRNFETIIVDDSESSITGDMLEGFRRAQSDVLRYFKREERKGVASARNFGVNVSSGELIAFLDDDDEWLPNKLERQINIIDKSSRKTGVVHCNCFVVNDNKKYLYHTNMLKDQSLDRLLEFDFVANSTALIRKECFEQVGFFDERMAYGEDWDFYIRVAKKFEFRYLHEPLATMHWDKGGAPRLSVDLEKKTRGYQIIINKHWQEFEKRKRTLAQYATIIGSSLCRMTEYKRGRQYLIMAYKVYPLSIVPLLLLATNSPISESRIFQRAKQVISKSALNEKVTSAHYFGAR